MYSYRFIVHGKVQGVYYRGTVAQEMKKVGLSGTIQNLDDGTVEVCVTMNEEDYPLVISILEEGSAKSEVSHIDQKLIEEHFDKGFTILR